jgi:hypothetical protein
MTLTALVYPCHMPEYRGQFVWLVQDIATGVVLDADRAPTETAAGRAALEYIEALERSIRDESPTVELIEAAA